MNVGIDVLLTDGEVAEMQAQAERAAVAEQENAARAGAAKQARAATMAKLQALGRPASIEETILPAYVRPLHCRWHRDGEGD